MSNVVDLGKKPSHQTLMKRLYMETVGAHIEQLKGYRDRREPVPLWLVESASDLYSIRHKYKIGGNGNG